MQNTYEHVTNTTHARHVFYMQFNGDHNAMTPEILGYCDIQNTFYVELSRGKGLNNEYVYGVTVIENTENGHEHRTDLSRLFDNKRTANIYISNLYQHV